MKLIDILRQELPKRGGWPEGAEYAKLTPGGMIKFSNNAAEGFYPENGTIDSDYAYYEPVVTRGEYEHSFEKQRAIDEMVRLSGVSTGAAKILYDAGYRK